MSTALPKIRLYVPKPYAEGIALTLEEKQSHYLANVMRLKEGDGIKLFNGTEGEWLAHITSVQKKSVTLELVRCLAPQRTAPDVWLAFAPIKGKSELVVEKAVELGVSKLIAVITRHAVVRSVNEEKLSAHAMEAAEQCERHDVPELSVAQDLRYLLGDWPEGRMLFHADETGTGAPAAELFARLPNGPVGLLIGPEGGFAAEELALLKDQPFVHSFGMGPRILRADTAAVAALACLQALRGDWNEKPHFQAID